MKSKKKQKKQKEVTCTEYKLMYRKKADPGIWFIKCICETEQQANKFLQILLDVSDVYAELKIVPVTVHKMI